MYYKASALHKVDRDSKIYTMQSYAFYNFEIPHMVLGHKVLGRNTKINIIEPLSLSYKYENERI